MIFDSAPYICPMNILILGSGGREHVFAWKIKQSPLCNQLFCAPGNAGTAQCGTNIDLNPLDFEAVKSVCTDLKIDMIVPGNEDPLVHGLVDYMKQHMPELKVAGPSKSGARLEGSKDFAKEFMIRHNIPTARFSTFDVHHIPQAKGFLKTLHPPYVLKADGLAAGKGVVILDKLADAEKELNDMLLNCKFGEASAKVVIEEFLTGIEVSCFVLTDGKDYLILPEAKDYKRIGEGDTGPNTGGMGAVSPVPFADAQFMAKVEERVIIPTIEGLKKDKIEYCGFVFFGLMNCNGNPYVIEYNVRMGDPETEVVIPRIQNDLVELLLAACDKNISKQSINTSSRTATTVFTVSGGYPGNYKKGLNISRIPQKEDLLVFHAGTFQKDDALLTSGGRVMAFTGLGKDIHEALSKSFAGAESVHFEGKYFRKDIGKDLFNYYEQNQSEI
jgi:phosphoribosylamine---glycine ligase